jgi:hypothetical protein
MNLQITLQLHHMRRTMRTVQDHGQRLRRQQTHGRRYRRESKYHVANLTQPFKDTNVSSKHYLMGGSLANENNEGKKKWS